MKNNRQAISRQVSFNFKLNVMAQRSNTDKGKPSGVDKPMEGTGIPTKINDENRPNDQRLTEDYTADENEIADGVRTMHPNRNEDKDNATNIGGYRG